MSHSKLEYLPNEILLNLFENYINGVDIVVAFNHQLNQRFTSLIHQMRRMTFDFSRCRKDDFRFCLGLLPAYANKVEKLVLCDATAPGQTYGFFVHYPSLNVFPRLRIFALEYRTNENDEALIGRAIKSLINTNIEVLLVVRKPVKENYDTYPVPIFEHIFCLRTLKHLRLYLPDLHEQSLSRSFDMPHLETLSLDMSALKWHDFQRICQQVPQLKSLHMRIAQTFSHLNTPMDLIPRTTMSRLHTLNLIVNYTVPKLFDMLTDSFQTTPVLRHLTIGGHASLILAEKWQNIIETSLPLLEDFVLWIDQNDLPRVNKSPAAYLDSFQTGFWIDRRKFHFIIVEYAKRNSSKFDLFADYDMKYPVVDTKYVNKLTIAPKRQDQSDICIVDRFSYLNLTGMNPMDMSEYRLKQVESVLIETGNFTLEDDSFRTLDCSRIKRLIIPFRDHRSKNIVSILNYMKNLSNLIIDHNFLYDISVQCPSVRSLYLCQFVSPLDVAAIDQIARCFPFLESLVIGTEKQTEISKLMSCCPYLRCLIIEKGWIDSDLWFSDSILDRTILAAIEGTLSTRIWLDHNAIVYFSTSASSAKENNRTMSKRTSRKKNRVTDAISSFFRRFKS